MTAGSPILLIDDDAELHSSLKEILEAMCYSVQSAHTAMEGKTLFEASQLVQAHVPFNCILLDMCLPDQDGFSLLPFFRKADPSIPVIVITAHGNIPDAVKAMQLGAYSYLEKPIEEQELSKLLQNIQKAKLLAHQVGFCSPKVFFQTGETLIGTSRKMKTVFEIIKRVSQVDTSVLIRGENGTGKELVARAVHFYSPQKDRPFIAINCAAIPETLFESELFGYEKGAFTGADRRHIGKFQQAQGGTIFLDEISEMPVSTQAKLLRVLQEKTFNPLGSLHEIRLQVRIIAATNRNLEELIQKQQFRLDLYYRLNIIPIELPPLRDRKEDIPLLLHHFIQKFNKKHVRQTPIQSITPKAQEALLLYPWPGNIRELENIIERAFILEPTSILKLSSLPPFIQKLSTTSSTTPLDYAYSFIQQKEAFEKKFILEALQKNKGRINKTASQTGIPKNTLLRKIKKYGIRPTAFRISP